MPNLQHKLVNWKGLANRAIENKIDPQTWADTTKNVTVRREGTFEKRHGYAKISVAQPFTGPVRIGFQIKDRLIVIGNGTIKKSTISQAY